MKHWRPAAALLVAAIAAPPTWAQSGGVYEIIRSTIDGGGSTERSDEEVVIRGGTIGQPDIGAMSNGSFDLAGGFWPSRGQLGIIFRDGFETGDAAAWTASMGLPPAPDPEEESKIGKDELAPPDRRATEEPSE